jgi:cyanophycin synthetase
LNVFDEHPFRVIVDYAHNPAAFRAMRDLIERLRPGYNRVIGVMSAPGDRRDIDLREDGQIASTMFDIMVLKEDDDRRGRKDGAISAIIREAAMEAGMRDEQIIVVLDERAAVRHALSLGRAGDLIVVFADNITPVWKTIIYYGKPQSDVERSEAGE